MKLEYKGTFPLNSVQKKFTPNTDEVYEVTEEDGNYLLNTFKGLFKKVEEKQEPKKEEVKEVEPEVVETNPTPKKTTTRKTGTKKSETEK